MGKILESDGKAILIMFVGVIIAVVFLGSIANSIFTQTNTFTNSNETVTAPAVNGTLDLTGRQLISQIDIYNITNSSQSLVNLGGSLQTGTTGGLLTVQLTLNDTAAAFAGQSVNVSYTYNPDGYLSSGGSRSIQTLVIIMGSLAIVVFVIIVFMKVGSMKNLMRK